MMNLLRSSSLGAFALTLFLSGCTPEVSVDVTVVDRETGEPIPNALLSIEVGGIYVENDDTSKGPPAYQHGGRTDDQGRLTVLLPEGEVGFHSFFDGYRYGRDGRAVAEGDAVEIRMARMLADDVPPTVSDVTMSPTTVSPGGEVTVTAMVAASTSKDPLSDETLIILDRGNFTIAMDPPSAGEQGVGFPDGLYQKSFDAPEEPGTYSVTVVATSEQCLTATPVTLELIVE